MPTVFQCLVRTPTQQSNLLTTQNLIFYEAIKLSLMVQIFFTQSWKNDATQKAAFDQLSNICL